MYPSKGKSQTSPTSTGLVYLVVGRNHICVSNQDRQGAVCQRAALEPIAGQVGLSTSGVKNLIASSQLRVVPDCAGGYRVSGAVNRVKRLLTEAGASAGEVARRSRGRLGKALGVGCMVGVCVVSLATLLAGCRALLAARKAEASKCTPRLHWCGFDSVVVRGGVEMHAGCALVGFQAVDQRLVAHLSQYTMFRRRDRSLLLSLCARALAWRERNHVSDHCFRVCGPVSVMSAFMVGASERAALDMMNTSQFRLTLRETGGKDLVAATHHETLLEAIVSSGPTAAIRHLRDLWVGCGRLISA